MVSNIVKGIKKSKSKNTWVVVGINHAKRIEDSLFLLGHKVKRIDVSSKKDIDGYLERIYKYEVLNKIEHLKIPPLVPIFVLVFKRISKIVKKIYSEQDCSDKNFSNENP